MVQPMTNMDKQPIQQPIITLVQPLYMLILVY